MQNLNLKSDFKHWISQYIRRRIKRNNEKSINFLDKEASPIDRKIFITVIYSYLVREGGVWIYSQIYSYINFAILIIPKKKKEKERKK